MITRAYAVQQLIKLIAEIEPHKPYLHTTDVWVSEFRTLEKEYPQYNWAELAPIKGLWAGSDFADYQHPDYMTAIQKENHARYIEWASLHPSDAQLYPAVDIRGWCYTPAVDIMNPTARIVERDTTGKSVYGQWGAIRYIPNPTELITILNEIIDPGDGQDADECETQATADLLAEDETARMEAQQPDMTTHQIARSDWDTKTAHNLFTNGWDFSKDVKTTCPCCGQPATRVIAAKETKPWEQEKRRVFVVCEFGATEIEEQTIEMTDQQVFDYLDNKTNPQPVTERRATIDQCRAIHTQLAKWSTRRQGYEQRLMSKLFGRTISKVSELTTSEASALEIHLARIARGAYNHTSLTCNANMNLNTLLKMFIYPDDKERAKATYALLTTEMAYQVTLGRTGNFKRMTEFEATEYANNLDRQMMALEKEYRKQQANGETSMNPVHTKIKALIDRYHADITAPQDAFMQEVCMAYADTDSASELFASLNEIASRYHEPDNKWLKAYYSIRPIISELLLKYTTQATNDVI